ncbi:methyltransferase domain-containing protein [Halogeometricum sp. S1BR25-6]|uniref:Methyltransferase domain-containing protein n=1 Tax=Halogeometricum salsisoli TaxID=2950536 RepID=A0ABU2GBB9_9EURY|nr:methyltransferase domain-containing protein [Halogeometricum sp. S1BR25-6]MDS0297428.1 methyltransferase domain-containing protein [Halogeometricum sp. S1BR25-6]
MVDKDAVRRSYDELADAYAAQRGEDGRDVAILSAFLETLPESPRVLDAGCGRGTPVLSRASAEGDAVGLDFSRAQLRAATENAPEASHVRGDMAALPFADDAFDAVVAYWSLIHLPAAEHPTVLDEFARVLRPGGRVLLSEGTTAWDGENPDWLDTGVSMEWSIAGAATTREHLRGAGFAVVDEWGTRSPLAADRAEEAEDRTPWTFFAARLES